jgi:hypothetical protein
MGKDDAAYKDYIDSEIQLMLAEVVTSCPVESKEFNAAAIKWIEKNAARFRKKWEMERKNPVTK